MGVDPAAAWPRFDRSLVPGDGAGLSGFQRGDAGADGVHEGGAIGDAMISNVVVSTGDWASDPASTTSLPATRGASGGESGIAGGGATAG